MKKYTYSELSDKAKQVVIEANRDCFDYDWWDGSYDLITCTLEDEFDLTASIEEFDLDRDCYVELGLKIDSISSFLKKNQKYFDRESYLLMTHLPYYNMSFKYEYFKYCESKIDGVKKDRWIDNSGFFDTEQFDTCDSCGKEKAWEEDRDYEEQEYCDCSYPLDIINLDLEKLSSCIAEVLEDASKRSYEILSGDYEYYSSDEYISNQLEECDDRFYTEDGEEVENDDDDENN